MKRSSSIKRFKINFLIILLNKITPNGIILFFIVTNKLTNYLNIRTLILISTFISLLLWFSYWDFLILLVAGCLCVCNLVSYWLLVRYGSPLELKFVFIIVRLITILERWPQPRPKDITPGNPPPSLKYPWSPLGA